MKTTNENRSRKSVTQKKNENKIDVLYASQNMKKIDVRVHMKDMTKLFALEESEVNLDL